MKFNVFAPSLIFVFMMTFFMMRCGWPPHSTVIPAHSYNAKELPQVESTPSQTSEYLASPLSLGILFRQPGRFFSKIQGPETTSTTIAGSVS